MALILDGKKVRDEIAHTLKGKIAEKTKEGFVKPCLAIIQIGNNKESEAYIHNKKVFGAKVGAEVIHVHLPEIVTEDEVRKEIQSLNDDDSVHGIIIQLPLPKHIHKENLIESVMPKKDVDGLCAVNVKGLWIHNKDTVIPATTRGVFTLLAHYGIEIAGKHVVVIGRSTLVGKPTALTFLNNNATVTVCHSETKNLEYHTLEADIIVTAVGRPRLLTELHVKPHQVIIDVGITIEDIPERRSVGDVAYEEVSKIVYALSPVPGGVGPMTVASLFENLFDAYLKKLVI